MDKSDLITEYMIIEQLIDEFITKHVFPQFREWSHPTFPDDRYFIIGDDEYPIAMMSPFYDSLATLPFSWGAVQNMFSLTEDETKTVLKRWLNKNVPLIHFNGVTLVNYP